MTETPDRRVLLRTVLNLRSLEGLPVDGGTVRSGELFRSATLANVSSSDLSQLGTVGLTTVYDLRTQEERDEAPDRLPAGVRGVHVDVLADCPTDIAAHLGGLYADMESAKPFLLDGKGPHLLAQTYREMIALPSARKAYRRMLVDLADSSRQGAALFHCTSGKDRTGWASAIVLYLLGADDDTVRSDYLQSNTDLRASMQPVLDHAESYGIDEDLVLPVLGVDDAYLQAALDEMHSRFGSFDSYVSHGLQVSQDTVGAIRERLVAS